MQSRKEPFTDSFASLRLRRHADYQRVYQGARKQHGRQMSFFFRLRHPEEEAGPGPRIGLTVGKVLGKAHERNRIKRRLREAVRLQAGLLQSLAVDVVLHPRRSLLLLEWENVESEVRSIFQTVHRQAVAHVTNRPIGKEPEGNHP